MQANASRSVRTSTVTAQISPFWSLLQMWEGARAPMTLDYEALTGHLSGKKEKNAAVTCRTPSPFFIWVYVLFASSLRHASSLHADKETGIS